MGFNFSFFGRQEMRKFNYRPRFYDPEADARREKYGDFTKPKDQKYTPGSHLKGSLRDGSYSKTKDMSKNQRFLGAVGLLLLFAILFFLLQYMPKLMESLAGNEESTEQIVNEDEYQIVNID